MDQPIEKFVHPIPSQSYHAPDGNAFAQFEVCDGSFGARHHRFLPRDGGNFGNRRVDSLDILRRFAYANVYRDLLQPRYLHGVLVVELLHHSRDYLILIFAFQSCHAGSTTPTPRRSVGRS